MRGASGSIRCLSLDGEGSTPESRVPFLPNLVGRSGDCPEHPSPPMREGGAPCPSSLWACGAPLSLRESFRLFESVVSAGGFSVLATSAGLRLPCFLDLKINGHCKSFFYGF